MGVQMSGTLLWILGAVLAMHAGPDPSRPTPEAAAQHVLFADQFAGDDAGAKISGCIADLPSDGGTCDARGLKGKQVFSAPVRVDKPVLLLFGAAVFIARAGTTPAFFDVLSGDVELRGAGSASIFRATSGLPTLIRIGNSAKDVTIHYLHFEGGTVTGNLSQQAAIGIVVTKGGPPSRITISHCLFSGSDERTGLNYAVFADTGTSYLTITHNRIEGIFGTSSGHGHGIVGAADWSLIADNVISSANSKEGRHAIYLGVNSSHNLILRNRIRGFTSSQIVVGSASGTAACHNIIAENELIDDNPGRVNLQHFAGAIQLSYGAHFNKIVANFISRAAPYGIVLDGGSRVLSSDNEVLANVVCDSWYSGILDRGGERNTIAGNFVYHGSQAPEGSHSGIVVASAHPNGSSTGVRVVGNCIDGGGFQKHAIEVRGTTPPRDTQVVGNLSRGILAENIQDRGVGSILVGNSADGKGTCRRPDTPTKVVCPYNATFGEPCSEAGFSED
jgi:hypothetical protein